MSCNYQGYEFGANYPDSVCINGRLFDADDCDDEGNLYEPVENIPCPICHPKKSLHYWTERHRNSGLPEKEAADKARAFVNHIRSTYGFIDVMNQRGFLEFSAALEKARSV